MIVRYEPAGLHYFDRSSGIHLQLEEIIPPADIWSAAPRFLSIALTNACELSCAYCFAPKYAARLATDAVLGWIDEASKNGCLGVGFGGGEPTLHPGFAVLCRQTADNTEMSVSFTTHGHWRNPKLADELAGRVHFIRLSMDGINCTYERLRGRSFGDFMRAVTVVKATSRFGINFVVNDDTIYELSAAADFAMAHGAEEFLLLPEVAVQGRRPISETTMANLHKWIVNNSRYYPLRTSSTYADTSEIPVARTTDGRRFMDFLHIDASGRMKPCAFEDCGPLVANYPSLLDALKDLDSYFPASLASEGK